MRMMFALTLINKHIKLQEHKWGTGKNAVWQFLRHNLDLGADQFFIYMCSGTFLPLHMAYGIVWDSYSDAIVVWLSIF